jgi:hypothetical protein
MKPKVSMLDPMLLEAPIKVKPYRWPMGRIKRQALKTVAKEVSAEADN